MFKHQRIYSVLCAVLLFASCGEKEQPAASVDVEKPNARLTRRAVLIGIDDYSASRIQRKSGLQPAPDRSFTPLHGAVRDVEWMRNLLVLSYGFDPQGILILRNQEATREAIIEAIEKHLIAFASEKDVLLFYFAGHGSQVGNSLSTERDRLDESIVPADSKLGVPDLRDKELAVLFNRVLDRKARLTVIYDSCHSGSGARALRADAASRSMATDSRDIRDATEPPSPESRGALVMSASQDFARAFEAVQSDGQYHGMFSWALLNAMRDPKHDEPALDTFLRAQAMMRADSPYQEPVIGGDVAAQSRPLLSPAGGLPRRTTIAVEQVRSDGTVVLQGGWIHGLTKGSVVRMRNDEHASTQIRITNLHGLARSEGRFETTMRAAAGELKAGTLLEIAEWAALEGRPLRVWMPRTRAFEDVSAFAKNVRDEARASRVKWIEDPTVKAPTHTLRWRDDAWELVHSDGSQRKVTAATFVRDLPSQSSLFVQIPASSALVTAVGVGPETDYSSVESRTQPDNVDYVLAGRLFGDAIEYAWVRPEVHQDDASKTPLPPRSDWFVLDSHLPEMLRTKALRLHAILAWHHLASPVGVKSPYRLALIDSVQESEIKSGVLIGEERYELRLQLVDPLARAVRPRFYYVFAIDSFGKSILLFPLRGSVENQFPIDSNDIGQSREIDIGAVRIHEPYGVDTYFLVSTDESLPNPAIFQSSGIRTRGPLGGTPLEELLSRTGGTSRTPNPEGVQTAPIWSIDRTMFLSIPPQKPKAVLTKSRT